jgi:cyclohexa-1,5-dienecarbonyl-CoA hydratase
LDGINAHARGQSDGIRVPRFHLPGSDGRPGVLAIAIVSVQTIQERNGAWLRVVLDTPTGNLLSLEMVRALAGAIDGAAAGRKWITFEGAGRDFCFGAKIQEHVPGPMEQVLPETHALFRRILELPAPTAALVHGRCLGGGFELALTCDVIIASDAAVFGLPEIQLAAFPPAGAVLLPLRVGASRAAAAVITGERIAARACYDVGLVREIAPAGELIETAGRWFDSHLAPRSGVALGAAAVSSRLTLRSIADPALAAAEKLYLDRVLPTADAAEGVRAFVEKRVPRWKDQ